MRDRLGVDARLGYAESESSSMRVYVVDRVAFVEVSIGGGRDVGWKKVVHSAQGQRMLGAVRVGVGNMVGG